MTDEITARESQDAPGVETGEWSQRSVRVLPYPAVSPHEGTFGTVLDQEWEHRLDAERDLTARENGN
jgi:hypothetical protein